MRSSSTGRDPAAHPVVNSQQGLKSAATRIRLVTVACDELTPERVSLGRLWRLVHCSPVFVIADASPTAPAVVDEPVLVARDHIPDVFPVAGSPPSTAVSNATGANVGATVGAATRVGAAVGAAVGAVGAAVAWGAYQPVNITTLSDSAHPLRVVRVIFVLLRTDYGGRGERGVTGGMGTREREETIMYLGGDEDLMVWVSSIFQEISGP
eukprot:1277325-Prymnesium_polylepis.3